MKRINHTKRVHLCKDKEVNIWKQIDQVEKQKIIQVFQAKKKQKQHLIKRDFKGYYLIQKFRANTVHIIIVLMQPMFLYQHQIWVNYVIYRIICLNIVNLDKNILTIHMFRMQQTLILLISYQMEVIYLKHKKQIKI